METPKKNILIFGGTGFIGSGFLHLASKNPHVILTSLQRTLPSPENTIPNVKYMTGSALHPETYVDIIKEADVIIHSIGILFDSAVKRKAPIGGPGSYEEMNYETAKKVSDSANLMTDKKRKFLYLSANSGLPFIPRYRHAKTMAEEHVSNLPNLTFNSFRAGFVWDFKVQKWRRPLSSIMGLQWRVQQMLGIKDVNNDENKSRLTRFAENFKVGKPTDRNDLARALLFCSLSNFYDDHKIMGDDEIVDASKKLDELQ